MTDLTKIMFGNIFKMMALKWGILIALRIVYRRLR